MLFFQEEYYTYIPNPFGKLNLCDVLHQDIQDKCTTYNISHISPTASSRRISCFFTSKERKKEVDQLAYYGKLEVFEWKESKILNLIRNFATDLLDIEFDYCLVHIYRDGNDCIGWHCDKEALNSEVLSMSFGATRKFRIKRNRKDKGWEEEFSLKNGDLFLMKTGFQRKYVHSVPIEKRVKDFRVNLTFRKIE